MSYPCPFKFRAFDGRKMVTVQSLCWNQGGALWYGPGNQFGWAWVNEAYDGWNENNPKPGKLDVCPLMRWTGLYDKNGVEIWEGDVVTMGDYRVVVCFGRFAHITDETNGIPSTNTLIGWYTKLSDADEEIGYGLCPNLPLYTVLGNIHEHSDLLKS